MVRFLSAFWEHHQRDMESPEYAREFADESIRTSNQRDVVEKFETGDLTSAESYARLEA